MAETKPRSEQIRFISDETGEHLLDAYLEAAERGGLTLGALMDIIFDSSGDINPTFVQFRLVESPPGTFAFQFRTGAFVDPEAGWIAIADPVFQTMLTQTVTAKNTAVAAAATATAQAILASQWATQLVTPVAGGEYSAKYHAQAAAASDASAATHDTNAALSAAQALAAANGMKFRSARAATTANITLSAPQTIDGVSVIAGDRVLVRNQSTAANNGIYVVAAGAWTRAAEMDTWAEVPGVVCIVEEGTTQGDTAWICTSNSGGTLGVTAITFNNWSQAILDATIALTKLATQAAGTVLANTTGGAASPAAVTYAALKSAGSFASSGANTDITSLTGVVIDYTSTVRGKRDVQGQNASFTIGLTDAGKTHWCNPTTSMVITIPLDATTNFPVGTEIEFVTTNVGSGVSFAATGGVSLVSADSYVKLNKSGSGAVLKKLFANLWILMGDLKA